MRTQRAALGLAAALLPINTIPITPHQPDPWVRQVRRELQSNQTTAGLLGYELTHDPFVGSLNEGRYRTHTATLRAGTEYAVTAVCDADCSDLDLQVLRDSTKVAEDVEVDDFPMVVLKPRSSGTYRIRVIMESCDDSPCRYGIGIYGR